MEEEEMVRPDRQERVALQELRGVPELPVSPVQRERREVQDLEVLLDQLVRREVQELRE